MRNLKRSSWGYLLGFAIAIFCFDSIASGPEQVTYQINAMHDGVQTFDRAPTFPMPIAWRVPVPDLYLPDFTVVSQDKLFYSGYDYARRGIVVTAINLKDGSRAWGPVEVGGRTPLSQRARLAYHEGRLFVIRGDGFLQAMDAETGTPGWSVELDNYSFLSNPSASDGVVYIEGEGYGSRVYAVDAASGELLWERKLLRSGGGSPTVGENGIYISSDCQENRKLSINTGAIIWYREGRCNGGSISSAAYSSGRLYSPSSLESGTIMSGTTGRTLGTLLAGRIPAVSGSVIYTTTRNDQLVATDAATSRLMWTFPGHGPVMNEPRVINGIVFVDSGVRITSALDGATGAVLWEDLETQSVIASSGQGLLIKRTPEELLAFGEYQPDLAPPSLRFVSRNSPDAPAGRVRELYWSSSHANQCKLEFKVAKIDNLPPSGHRTVLLESGRNVFGMTCRGAGGSIVETQTLYRLN